MWKKSILADHEKLRVKSIGFNAAVVSLNFNMLLKAVSLYRSIDLLIRC